MVLPSPELFSLQYFHFYFDLFFIPLSLSSSFFQLNLRFPQGELTPVPQMLEGFGPAHPNRVLITLLFSKSLSKGKLISIIKILSRYQSNASKQNCFFSVVDIYLCIIFSRNLKRHAGGSLLKFRMQYKKRAINIPLKKIISSKTF